MKVLFVTGSYPPEACGVGDYTACLSESLNQRGIQTSVLTKQDWSVIGAARVLKLIRSNKADIVHIQYPTLGFGYKLGPQLLALRHPTVVTLHEASRAHLLRRASLYGFSIRTEQLVFTNEFEMNYSTRWCPWIRHKAVVIPLGSNVRVAIVPDKEQSSVLGYFGLIRPNKGLESLLEAALLLHLRQSSLRVRIIGRVMAGHESYYQAIRARGRDLPIEWCINPQDEELAMMIGSCRFAYLPFPDGASERRASLLAFLAAGTCVITTKGAQTPSYLGEAVKYSEDVNSAIQIVDHLATDPDKRKLLRDRALSLSLKFEWDYIADCHSILYHEILDSR